MCSGLLTYIWLMTSLFLLFRFLLCSKRVMVLCLASLLLMMSNCDSQFRNRFLSSMSRLFAVMKILFFIGILVSTLFHYCVHFGKTFALVTLLWVVVQFLCKWCDFLLHAKLRVIRASFVNVLMRCYDYYVKDEIFVRIGALPLVVILLVSCALLSIFQSSS